MKELNTKRIETDRLILRKLTVDDAEEAFNNWTGDSRTSRYLPWDTHENVETTKELFSFWENEYNNNYTYRWIVELKDTHELIGTIDAVSYSIWHKRVEIGYCYGPKYWGNGYATEALKAVINYMFDAGFDMVTATHLVSNPNSGHVMEKSGLHYDATLKLRYINTDGEREDIKVYSILK